MAVRTPFGDVTPTALDRVIGWLSPAAGTRRIIARGGYQALDGPGGYQGGRTGRRALRHWRPGGGSADADVLPTVQTMRDNSRDLERNSPIGGAAINRATTLTVGAGLTLKPQIDGLFLGLDPEDREGRERDFARRFRHWSRSKLCDVTLTQTFEALEGLVFRAVLQSGDIFVVRRFVAPPGDRERRLALQLYEADQVTNPDGLRDGARLTKGRGAGRQVAGGVEIDENGAAVAVHFLTRHPGNVQGEGIRQWRRVPVFSASGRLQILHLFDRRRPGQTRGVPYLGPVIEQLRQLSQYAEAELWAAVIGAMITVVWKSNAPAQLKENESLRSQGDSPAPDDYRFEPASVLEIGNGDDVTVPESGRPNRQFDPFFVAIVRQIGATLEIPFEVLIMHFTASYSAGRAALEMAAQFVRGRRAWLVANFCDPVYDWFLEDQVARGAVSAPGFLTDPLIRQAWTGADWRGPARISLDPVRETKAYEIAEDRGWRTADGITAELTGGDWEKNNEDRARENRLRQDRGTAIGPSGQTGSSAAAADDPATAADQPTAPADQPEDETRDDT